MVCRGGKERPSLGQTYEEMQEVKYRRNRPATIYLPPSVKTAPMNGVLSQQEPLQGTSSLINARLRNRTGTESRVNFPIFPAQALTPRSPGAALTSLSAAASRISPATSPSGQQRWRPERAGTRAAPGRGCWLPWTIWSCWPGGRWWASRRGPVLGCASLRDFALAVE